jgi:hypothetical protein
MGKATGKFEYGVLLLAGAGLLGTVIWADLPNLQSRLDNPRGTGTEIAVGGAALLALERLKLKSKILRVAAGVAIAGGVGACITQGNEGHSTPGRQANSSNTSTSGVTGPNTFGARVHREDGRMTIQLPSFVSNYGCNDAETPPHMVEAGDTTLSIIDLAHPGEGGGYTKKQRDAIVDALKAANPGVNLNLIYPGRDIIDIVCPPAITASTATTAASVPGSSSIPTSTPPRIHK